MMDSEGNVMSDLDDRLEERAAKSYSQTCGASQLDYEAADRLRKLEAALIYKDEVIDQRNVMLTRTEKQLAKDAQLAASRYEEITQLRARNEKLEADLEHEKSKSEHLESLWKLGKARNEKLEAVREATKTYLEDQAETYQERVDQRQKVTEALAACGDDDVLRNLP